MYGCESDDRICSEGVRRELVDESLGDMVAAELERNSVSFRRISKGTFCYELSFDSQVTRAVIAAHSKKYPIGRIDVIRTIEVEVKEALDNAGIRYSASVQGDYLVLTVDPGDVKRANEIISGILKKKY